MRHDPDLARARVLTRRDRAAAIVAAIGVIAAAVALVLIPGRALVHLVAPL